MRVKAASRIRRWMLGAAMRLPGGGGSTNLESLLSKFPDEALMPLRRTGLDPIAELGERPPVSRLKLPLGLRGWLVTGYAESRAVLAGDLDTFSNDFGHMVGKVGIAAEQDPGGLGFADPPAHTRLRHMLTPHFTTRALARRAPRVHEIIEEALDEVARLGADGTPVDLQQHFAVPIPSRVIMELLGVPDTDQSEFQRLSAARFDFSSGAAGSLDPILRAIELLAEVVAKQRVEPVPGLISTVLAEYGDDVSDVELAGLADGVLTGGLETTVSMLALGAIVLMQDGAAATALRDGRGRCRPLRRGVAAVPQRRASRLPALRGEGHDARREADPARRRSALLAERRQPRRAALPAPASGRREARAGRAPRVRSRPAPLRRRRTRTDGASDGLSGARAPIPHLRMAVPARELSYRDLSFVYGLTSLPVLVD